MSAAIDLRALASALGGDVAGNEVLAPGPNHGRTDRSLSVKLVSANDDGFVVHSFSHDDPMQCRDYVRGRLGMPKWEPKAPGGGATAPIRYVYEDREGRPYLRVTRTADKKFWQHQWDGSAWAKGVPKGPKVPYRLRELLAAPADAPVYVCEGEKNTDAVRALGLVATTNSEGAGKWTADLSSYLAGRSCYVLEDNDAPGAKHIRKVVEHLAGVAAEIRVVKLPGLRPKGDVGDWIEGGGSAEALEAICRSFSVYDAPTASDGPNEPRKRPSAPPRGTNDGRPTITIQAGSIHEAVDAVEEVLMARGGLYQRGNQIVFMGEAPVITHDKEEVTAARIFERGEHALAEDITRAACLMKWDARASDYVVSDCPSRLVKTFQERTGRFRLPTLTAIINAPTLRPDGSLLSVPGYDKATGLFFDPRGVTFPAVPEKPSRRDAERALDTLGDLLEGFPFEGQADRAVALSAILTACVRQALRTAPLHAFSAPVAGSGKSKLVDIASVTATGREAGVVAQAADDTEMEKRLGGLYLQGAGMVAIDNCTFPIDGNFLCAVLTQTVVNIRPLGTSRLAEVPTSTFLTATGNNLVIAGDMTRRTVVARLDPRVERPELRRFDFEPVAQAKAERVRYVTAALTIMLAYKVAGSPHQADPLGSFEGWSEMVRDALMWLGCADPVTTMEEARENDPKLQELTEVLTHWRAGIGTDPITVRRVIEKANKQSAPGGMGFATEYDLPDLREALLSVAGRGGAINSKALGRWLKANSKRIVGGASFEASGAIYDGAAMWQLKVQRASASTVAPADDYASRDPLY